ncbi:MAG: translation initiation factor IF-2 [Desulfobacterales bacterium]
MAKVRVYELARDLNMTNKDLLDRMSQLDIEVKSHMSSLDDEAVAQIKQSLFGGTAAKVEETRIRPTVIRRRRKIVPAEEAEAAKPEEEAVVAQEPPEPREPESEEAEVEPEAPPVAAAPTPRKAEEPPARIISAPKTEKPGPVEEVAEPEIPEEAAEPGVEEPVEIEAVAEAPSETVEPEVPAEADASRTVEAETGETVSAEAEEVPTQKRIKKVKKPSDQVAKIIKLPTTPVEPAALRERAKPAEPVLSEPAAEPAAAPGSAEDLKKRKKKRKAEEEDRTKKFVKKKISFRRKSVVEGADLYDDVPRLRKARKEAKAKAATQKTQITTAKAIKRRIRIDEAILLSDLAKRMGVKANEIIRTLMGMGVMATLNQSLDFETASLVAGEFNYEVENASFEEEAVLHVEAEDPQKMTHRPPVVTIMGHVDHGKTSLLDVIRKTHVTEMEAGGITQHIGAYSVETDKGHITFLDTPGHEAFTAMRSRGAKVTDLVVLVVAADDGVMPQTIEAINHARASEVPIIVAVNKIDKANANMDRVYRELSEQGLTPEDWGGDTICVKVSAKQAIGIDDLLEMILLQSEMLELKANPDRLATGHVVEAKLDSGRGPVATVLVNEGTLKAGDPIVCGIHHGKVRALINDKGVQVSEAGPSMPVEVIGLSGVPMAGDELVALKDEKDAKQVSLHRQQKQRTKELAKSNRLSLESLFEKMKVGEVKDLNLIIKTDVDGSMEALKDSLVKLSNEEVKINVVHAASGTITESDVSLAAVSNAIIIGFNVRPTPKVQAMAQEEHVDMRFHNVIYDVIKEVKDSIVGMMASRFEERVLGRAEVRDTFHIPKVGTIAGCYVTDGKIERGQRVRLLRDGVINYEGKISSLKRFKDDAKEVQSGYECGIGIENYNDIKMGDVIECFYLEEIRPEIE